MRASSRILDAFWWLLRGSTMHDLCNVFCRLPEAYNNIYIFDAMSSSASHPKCGDFPWPVAITLGTYSPKHIMVGKGVPNDSKYVRAVEMFASKLSFALSSTSVHRPWWKLFRPRATKPFPRKVQEPELQAFVNGFARVVSSSVKGTLCKAKLQRAYWHNCGNFNDYTTQWLLEKHLMVIQTDKDGGYCIAQHTSFST